MPVLTADDQLEREFLIYDYFAFHKLLEAFEGEALELNKRELLHVTKEARVKHVLAEKARIKTTWWIGTRLFGKADENAKRMEATAVRGDEIVAATASMLGNLAPRSAASEYAEPAAN